MYRNSDFYCSGRVYSYYTKKTNNNIVVTRLINIVPHRAKPSNLYRRLLENSRVYRVVKGHLSRKSSHP